MRKYRERAARDELVKIVPRRLNPRREAWLPIMHEEARSFHFTALFANTALAHKLGTTNDWVVIYYDGGAHDGQCTVVTEHASGRLAGLRVVRGRERECEGFYAKPMENA